MARQDIFLGTQRRNSRLEAFLKRNMDTDDYYRLRTYDSCIICSSTENKAFKFIIIDENTIHLSENPAKSLLQVIHLEDVISITMDAEPPLFLSGLEQENCQHVKLKYLTNTKEKKENKRNEDGDKMDNLKRILLTDEMYALSLKIKETNLTALSLSAKYGLYFSNFINKEICKSTVLFSLPVNENKLAVNEEPNFTKTVDSSNNIIFKKKNVLTFKSKKDTIKEIVETRNEMILIEETIDIYLLKKNSRIFYFLKSAWNSYKIRKASSFLNDFIQPKKNVLCVSERLEFLFDEMKNEIVSKNLSLEELFSSLLELKNAMLTNCILKKFFWKTDELLLFLISNFFNYIHIAQDSDKIKQYLNIDLLPDDIFELILLILEVIRIAFNESEIYVGRDACFNINNLHLLRFITALIETLPSQDLYLLTNIDRFKTQLIKESYRIIYELLIATEMQSQSLDCITSSLIISLFQESICLLSYVDHLVILLQENLLKNNHDSLNSDLIIDVYKQIYILRMFLQKDKKLLKHISKNYHVEFRYNLTTLLVQNKFSMSIKLSNDILQEFCTIRDLVLNVY